LKQPFNFSVCKNLFRHYLEANSKKNIALPVEIEGVLLVKHPLSISFYSLISFLMIISPSVKKIIDELHPGCPCKIIQSDVYRANLLVEIEGVMEFEY
jgi:hypothetical protein